jgi:hypothetical protein
MFIHANNPTSEDAMIQLSRTQIDALSDIRYSHSRVSMHWNTRRSLRSLGLIRSEFAPTTQRYVPVLTEIGRLVIDTIGQLTEGTAPLGTDELGNQITVMPLDFTTNIDLSGSY